MKKHSQHKHHSGDIIYSLLVDSYYNKIEMNFFEEVCDNIHWSLWDQINHQIRWHINFSIEDMV